VAKKPTGKAPLPIKMDLLSDEDREALSKEAGRSILEQMKQEARDAYFADALDRLRREQVPADQFVSVTLDLAPFAAFLLIDGHPFWHGQTYSVPVKQAAVLYEQAQRGWQHQDEIDGRSRFNAYRKPQQLRLGAQHAGTPTRGANGTVEAEL
jgi:hypothetical protein